MARAVKKLTSQLREVERVDARKVEPPKRTLRITPKRRAQLKLQGAYLGYMRQLKPAQKAAVKAVREKRGFEAAISVAKLTLSK
jgi:hypothetical protein